MDVPAKRFAPLEHRGHFQCDLLGAGDLRGGVLDRQRTQGGYRLDDLPGVELPFHDLPRVDVLMPRHVVDAGKLGLAFRRSVPSRLARCWNGVLDLQTRRQVQSQSSAFHLAAFPDCLQEPVSNLARVTLI